MCSVAYEITFQKFRASSELTHMLLNLVPQSTKHAWTAGEAAITTFCFAEMTANDIIWGTGIDKNDTRAGDTKEWTGCNVLGWALTETARMLFQQQSVNAHVEEDPSANKRRRM